MNSNTNETTNVTMDSNGRVLSLTPVDILKHPRTPELSVLVTNPIFSIYRTIGIMQYLTPTNPLTHTITNVVLFFLIPLAV